MLASALKLTGPVQEAFVAAARGRADPARVLAVRSEAAPELSAAAATRTLPRDIGGFTGREGELTGLENSLAKVAGGGLVAIYAIDGMAGIGKTTFAVHAAHRLAGRFPDGQFFLPLHAHTAGQSPVDPADALTSLLMTAGVAVQHIPPGLEARAAKWREPRRGQENPAAPRRRCRARASAAAAARQCRQPGAGHQPTAADRAGGRHRDQHRLLVSR